MTIQDALLPVPGRSPPGRKHSEGLEDALNVGRVSSFASADGLALPAHVRSTALPSATLNLVLAVLGAGQLTMPYAMKELGLPLGLFSLFFFTWLSMHSLKTLTLYELHFTPSGCLETFADLVIRVLGSVGSVICNALLVLYAWGGAVAFLVILQAEAGSLWCQYAHCEDPKIPGQLILLLLALLILWPLSSFEDLSFMKRFSPLGCVAAVIITVVTAGIFFTDPKGPETLRHAAWDEPLPAMSSRAWLVKVAAALPLLSFALNSTWAYIPILCTLKDRAGHTPWLILLSNTLILINYLFLSICGYGAFGRHTKPNILENLGTSYGSSWSVLVAKASLCVQLTLALPLRFFVARKTLLGSAPGGLALRGLVSLLLVSSAASLVLLGVPLTMVLGLTSSVCASMIIYILPAIIDLKLQLPGVLRKCCSFLSLLVGLVIMVAGCYANLTGQAKGS